MSASRVYKFGTISSAAMDPDSEETPLGKIFALREQFTNAKSDSDCMFSTLFCKFPLVLSDISLISSGVC